MPLSIKAPKRSDFAPLLHKLQTRLEGWKARFISRAGKLQLVKTVLSTMPTYFMSCFNFPKWLIARIDAIRRQFLWSRAHSPRPIHLINWRTVCLPIKNGGLGVIDLQLQNMSLLLRWWWRLFAKGGEQKLWATYVKAIYARRQHSHGPLILSRSGSFFWSALQKLKPLFHCCAQVKLDSGRQTAFWHEAWSGQPLAVQKLGILPRTTISVDEAKNCFHQLLPGPLTVHQNEAYQKISRFQPGQGLDKLLWTLSPTGTFTVKSVYTELSQGGKMLATGLSLWKAPVTPSMKLFFYLLLHDRLLTHEVMQRRNLNHVPGCVLCATQVLETTMHLFFRCPFTSAIWSTMSTALGYSVLNTQDSPLLTFLASVPLQTDNRRSWVAFFITTAWFLWKERNNRTFRHRATPHHILAAAIMNETALYLKYCSG